MFKFEFEAGGPWKLKILIFENSEMYWALGKFKVQLLECSDWCIDGISD